MEQLSIFVNGVALYRNETDIREYFQSFGANLTVTRARISKGGQAAFKVVVGEKTTYLRILEFKHHTLDGRLVQCQPFFKGKDLAMIINRMNNQRMIVKNAASKFIDEDILRIALEESFGIVETIFEMKTNTYLSKNKSTKLKKDSSSFSVLFERQKAADLAEKESKVYIKKFDLYLLIERFKYQNIQKAVNDNNLLADTPIANGIKLPKRLNSDLTECTQPNNHSKSLMRSPTDQMKGFNFSLKYHSCKPTGSTYNNHIHHNENTIRYNVKQPIPHYNLHAADIQA